MEREREGLSSKRSAVAQFNKSNSFLSPYYVAACERKSKFFSSCRWERTFKALFSEGKTLDRKASSSFGISRIVLFFPEEKEREQKPEQVSTSAASFFDRVHSLPESTFVH